MPKQKQKAKSNATQRKEALAFGTKVGKQVANKVEKTINALDKATSSVLTDVIQGVPVIGPLASRVIGAGIKGVQPVAQFLPRILRRGLTTQLVRGALYLPTRFVQEASQFYGGQRQ